jgi:hypothetical protein
METAGNTISAIDPGPAPVAATSGSFAVLVSPGYVLGGSAVDDAKHDGESRKRWTDPAASSVLMLSSPWLWSATIITTDATGPAGEIVCGQRADCLCCEGLLISNT